MNKAIGIFDSGVGGLSIWLELQKLLPNEDFIYLADSANCPYGDKTKEQVLELSKNNTDFLLSKNCKLIVVACNTATAAAIDYLRQNYTIPFVGMEPAVKPAALNTKTGKIGVLATQGTFKGKLFQETTEKYANGIETIIQPGDGLVEIVEENKINTPEAIQLLEKYINPMVTTGVDKIVLGCTHYPFLKPIIEKIIPDNIDIINPAPAVAKRSIELLKQNNLLAKKGNGKSIFYTSGKVKIIESLLYNITKYTPKVIEITPPSYTS